MDRRSAPQALGRGREQPQHDPGPRTSGLRVFVSSTLGELAAERLAVTAAITQTAADTHAVRARRQALRAARSVPCLPEAERRFRRRLCRVLRAVAPGMEVSGLEDEYRLSAGKPRLVYLKEAVRREPRLTGFLEAIEAEDVVPIGTSRTPTSRLPWPLMTWRSC